jgi:hypothetical protein
MIRPQNIFRLRERAGRASRVIVDLNERISNGSCVLENKMPESKNSIRALLKFYPAGAV